MFYLIEKFESTANAHYDESIRSKNALNEENLFKIRLSVVESLMSTIREIGKIYISENHQLQRA